MQLHSRRLLAMLAFIAVPASAGPAVVNHAAPELGTQVAGYAALPGRKALARAPGTDSYGLAYLQPDDLAASQSALADCESRRPAAAGAVCELTRLNAEVITTGGEIRARVGAEPHPLYLWRFQSAATTVYLAGSVHVLKPSLYPLPPQFEAAFAQADYLVVEVDTEGIAPADLQAQSMRHMLLPGQQTLVDVLPAPLHGRLVEHMAVYGRSGSTETRAKPAVLMNELVLARLTALGYFAAYGLEQHFRARLGTRRVLQLETLEAQLGLLFDQPIPMQIQLLADTLDQEYHIEPLLADMLAAWLSGDDARFLELFEQQAGESKLAEVFNRQLLDERNVGMAQKVRGYLLGQEGRGTYFVLAGAAHFIGPKGIIALLAGQGIRGARIMSNESVTDAAESRKKQSAFIH